MANDELTPSPLTPSLKETFPQLREAQATYLGAMDSLPAPNRLTHELIRLACSVILRHPSGIERHAMLAADFGATWEDVVGTLVLTQPGFGLVPAIDALPHARAGYERGLDDLASVDRDAAEEDLA